MAQGGDGLWVPFMVMKMVAVFAAGICFGQFWFQKSLSNNEKVEEIAWVVGAVAFALLAIILRIIQWRVSH